MKELDFITNLLEAPPIRDNGEFDFFSTQFVNSLEQIAQNSDPPYWHGRLLGLGYDESDPRRRTDFRISFLGTPLTEKEWRDKLDGAQIVVNKFDLASSPTYEENTRLLSPPLDPRIVTYVANIDAMVDGEHVTTTVKVTHKIRRTYLSYNTTIEKLG